MRVSAPVTDYIRASVINTKGDLFTRGDMVPERLAAGLLDTYLKAQGAGELPIWEKLALRDTGVKVDNLYRDSAGSQVITGVGFKPSVIIFNAQDYSAVLINNSYGFDDGIVHRCIETGLDGTQNNLRTGQSIYIHRNPDNYINGIVSSMDTDGFTLAWVRVGVAGCSLVYLAIP